MQALIRSKSAGITGGRGTAGAGPGRDLLYGSRGVPAAPTYRRPGDLGPYEPCPSTPQNKRIFTVLDLKHGYHQMPLHPDSRPCTAMSTPLGPMQGKVVPMGAKNGNAAFQRMMEDLLGPVRDCADPFVDDIIIGSGTENMTEDELIDAHEKDLRRVLSELDKHNMVCKPTKASLFVKEVEFAGHVVGHGQRRPMPGKLASLHHWEKPQTISELRSFMGFCNYYSGYVRM